MSKKRRKHSRRFTLTEGRRLSTNRYYRPKEQHTLDIKEQKSSSRNKKTLVLSSIINWLIFLVLFSMLAIASTLSKQPLIKITNGSYTYRNVSEYRNYAEQILGDSLLNQSKLFFRSSRFEDKIKQKYPEISNIVAITPLVGRDITVFISTSTPLANIINDKNAGIIDEDGVLVKNFSEDRAGEELLQISFLEPEAELNIGSKLFTKDETILLKLIKTELPKVPINGDQTLRLGVINFDIRNRQMAVHFKNVKFYAKINTYDNSEEQIGALKASIEQLDKEGNLPTSYIDVRVPGRVFVL